MLNRILLSIVMISFAVAQPSFTAADIATSADGARSVFVADMDGDGDMDLVSASANDNTIAWYENDGAANPSWTAADIVTNASAPFSVSVADMDNDGDMDIVSASVTNDAIAWYENDGAANPSWTAANIATSADAATSVFVADMDNDGDMDIVSASISDDAIAWYENNGAADPSWTAADIATSADGAQSVFVADMDNDGDMDIVSASYHDDAIAWYENDGAADPSWTAADIATSADGARSVFAADLDNDGDMDIVSASSEDDAIAWYENDGAANPSWTASDIATSADNAYFIFVADLDNDGDMDIVSASYLDDAIAWYENDGAADPSFTAADINTGADGAVSVFVADMDNDGDMDIVSTSDLDDAIAWYENDGAASNSQAAMGISAWTGVAAGSSVDGAIGVTHADIDGDGDLDIISAANIDDNVSWFINDGSPDGAGWTEVLIDASLDGAYAVDAADIDNDGDIDVIAAGFNANAIKWYVNDGTPDGPNWTATTVGIGASGSGAYKPIDVKLADVDSDGDLDVIGAMFYGHQVGWWVNDGTPAGDNWTKWNIEGYNTWQYASSVYPVDMDGDGDLDVLATADRNNSGGSDLTWFVNDGTPGNDDWTKTDIDTDWDGEGDAYPIDLDQD